MLRLLLMLGGVSIAAVLAVAFALLFIAGGPSALLLALGVLAAVAVATLADRTRLAAAALTVLAVLFAMYAGGLMAKGLHGAGSWFALLVAVSAAMGCGSFIALQRLRHAHAAGDARHPPDDPTLEMEVSRVPPVTAPSLRPVAWKPAAVLTAAGVVSAILLRAVPSPEGALAGDTAPAIIDPPIVSAVDADESAASSDSEPDAAAAPVVLDATARTTPPTAVAPPAAISTGLVTRTITPSLARRECLAQVESAHLFMNIARRSSSSTMYTRMTNPEIKRLAGIHPIGAFTLQHIAQRMWDRRADPERDPRWWAKQYARCEETRSDGGAYVVRG